MSALRAVLAAVRAAPPGTGLDAVARQLDLSRDEVEAMVDYWVRRGELTVEPLRSCSGGGCGSGVLRPRLWKGSRSSGGCAEAGGAGCPLAIGIHRR